MGLIAKIKEIIFKVKDYDRLEDDYCTVLDMVTGARLSKPNYTMDAVRDAFNEFLDEHDKEVYTAIKTGRYGIGFELKESYFNEAIKNCRNVEVESRQPTLFG